MSDSQSDPPLTYDTCFKNKNKIVMAKMPNSSIKNKDPQASML